MGKSIDITFLSLFVLMLVGAAIAAVWAGPDSPLTWSMAGVLLLIPIVSRKFADRTRIEWKDAYSVGIQSIDDQHKRLIDLMNNLETVVKYSPGEEFERKCLAALVDYTKTHFAFEEELMSKYGYPDFEAHKAQHEKMIVKVNEFVADYEKHPEKTIKAALHFLEQWLIRHINGTDKEYSEFLVGKGVH